jgi:hypothetical protein
MAFLGDDIRNTYICSLSVVLFNVCFVLLSYASVIIGTGIYM